MRTLLTNISDNSSAGTEVTIFAATGTHTLVVLGQSLCLSAGEACGGIRACVARLRAHFASATVGSSFGKVAIWTARSALLLWREKKSLNHILSIP